MSSRTVSSVMTGENPIIRLTRKLSRDTKIKNDEKESLLRQVFYKYNPNDLDMERACDVAYKYKHLRNLKVLVELTIRYVELQYDSRVYDYEEIIEEIDD